MYAILFDIDGTLINSRGAGRAAIRSAMRERFGIENPREVPLHGCTDRGIAENLFELHEVESTEENFARFRESYLDHLPRSLPQRNGFVLPGVKTLVQSLAQRPDVALGLLTGNVRAGARIKLEHFELFHFFEFGGFGDQHLDRDDVAREAREEVRKHLNGRSNGDRVWVIGDTPADVKCARAINARVLAVSTGGSTADDLRRTEPDIFLEDLSDPTELLELLA